MAQTIGERFLDLVRDAGEKQQIAEKFHKELTKAEEAATKANTAMTGAEQKLNGAAKAAVAAIVFCLSYQPDEAKSEAKKANEFAEAANREADVASEAKTQTDEAAKRGMKIATDPLSRKVITDEMLCGLVKCKTTAEAAESFANYFAEYARWWADVAQWCISWRQKLAKAVDGERGMDHHETGRHHETVRHHHETVRRQLAETEIGLSEMWDLMQAVHRHWTLLQAVSQDSDFPKVPARPPPPPGTGQMSTEQPTQDATTGGLSQASEPSLGSGRLQHQQQHESQQHYGEADEVK